MRQQTPLILFSDASAMPAELRGNPVPRRIPEAEAVMQRLAGFGMAVLLAMSLVGFGFDVAMARLGLQTVVAAPKPATPARMTANGLAPGPLSALPQAQPVLDAPVAPVVSAARRDRRTGVPM